MNTTTRAFADEATALTTTTVSEIAGLFCAAALLISTLAELLHAAHLA